MILKPNRCLPCRNVKEICACVYYAYIYIHTSIYTYLYNECAQDLIRLSDYTTCM